MPTVTLNRRVLDQLIGKKLSTESLKERIAMLGTALEHADEKDVIVEVFPNRPDMLSEQGFARALRSFLGIRPGLARYLVKKSGFKVIVDPSVTMRPYTSCAIVRGITFTDERIREIMQIQEKLATTHGRNRKKSAYGIYPVGKIKFPVTYIAKDPAKVSFRPLGFEQTIMASVVTEHHPQGRAYSHLTKGWKKYPFFIDADNNVLCMLPFTNSHDTGKVDIYTKDVFIECTGTDLNNTLIALNILVTMFADMGGQIYSIDIVYPDRTITTPNLAPRRMALNTDAVTKLLGLSLTRARIKTCLGKMGYDMQGTTALIPAYRADILHPRDLIEDIAIAYGYDNISAEIPRVATIGEEAPLERFMSKLRELLIGHKFQEICSFHLLSHDEVTHMMGSSAPAVHLSNALVDYTCLRNSILPSLLKVLQQNQHNEYPQCLFEYGMAFLPQRSAEYGVHEQPTLGITLSSEKADFTTIRQIVDSITHSLVFHGTVEDTTHPSFIEGRTAQLLVGNEKIAVFGELHPEVLGKWNVGMPVAAAEINVEVLFKVVSETP